MGGRGGAGGTGSQGLARRLEDAYLSEIENNPGLYGGQREAYSDSVSLASLRDKLSDVSREQFDEEILRLLDAGIVNITPMTEQALLTPADKKAAIMIGGKPKHMVSFIHPEDR